MTTSRAVSWLAALLLTVPVVSASPPQPRVTMPEPLRVRLSYTRLPDAKGRFAAEAYLEARVEIEEVRVSWHHLAQVRLDSSSGFQGPLARGERKTLRVRGRFDPEARGPTSLALAVEYPFPHAAMMRKVLAGGIGREDPAGRMDFLRDLREWKGTTRTVLRSLPLYVGFARDLKAATR